MDEKMMEQQAAAKEEALKEAIEKHSAQAQEGDVLAQFELGRCYYELGQFEQSLNWWTQAAEKGFSPALVRVGVQYAEGQGTERQEERAMECVQKAVKLNPDDANALCYLGMFYEQGIGVEPNIEQAVSCYQEASDKGDTLAPFMMAMCYMKGSGVKKDSAAAVEWAEMAAQRGEPEALYFMGMQYFLGEMTEVDMDKSVQYLEKAVEGGSLDALPLLNLVQKEIRMAAQRQQVTEIGNMLDEFEKYMTTGAMEEALWDDWDDEEEYQN